MIKINDKPFVIFEIIKFGFYFKRNNDIMIHSVQEYLQKWTKVFRSSNPWSYKESWIEMPVLFVAEIKQSVYSK